MRSMMCGRGEIIIACRLSRLIGRRWETGNRARSPVTGGKGSVAGLPFGRSTDTAGRTARAVVCHDVNGSDDEFVWLLAENEEDERIKNLRREVVILLQALRRNVKNLNANKRFLTQDDDNRQKSLI